LYWFEKSILPIYLTQGSDGVTNAIVSKTFENFQIDIKACLNNAIYDKLFEYYFTDRRALDIYLKQFFYNKLNSYELKNTKRILNMNQIIKTVEKGE